MLSVIMISLSSPHHQREIRNDEDIFLKQFERLFGKDASSFFLLIMTQDADGNIIVADDVDFDENEKAFKHLFGKPYDVYADHKASMVLHLIMESFWLIGFPRALERYSLIPDICPFFSTNTIFA